MVQSDQFSTGDSASARPFHLGYRPSLDGLRCVAILLVLIDHLEFGTSLAGFIGVDVFFVLSGFLITCLLIQEWEQSGDISLRSFYWRRALRLLPALLLMLAVFVCYAFLVDTHKKAIHELEEALRALFYSTNWSMAFHIGRTDFLSHTWSLSIEEQFYILWPLLLLFLLRRNNRTSLLWWVLLAALLSWLDRVALFIGGTQNLSGTIVEIHPWRIALGLDTRADSLLIGCATGIILCSGLLPRSNRTGIVLRFASGVSVIGLILFGFTYFFNPWVCCVGWFFISVFSALIIAQLIATSGSILHRLLESPSMVYIGKISYGIYLWHYPVFRALHNHFGFWRIIAIPATLVPVLLSYYLLERPCLRIKKRFEKVH